MKKLRLHDFHKSELEKQQQNALRGGACGCVCAGYICACACDNGTTEESADRYASAISNKGSSTDNADSVGSARKNR